MNSIGLSSQISLNQSTISLSSRDNSYFGERWKPVQESVGSMVTVGYAHKHFHSNIRDCNMAEQGNLI